MLFLVKISGLIPRISAFALMYSKAIVADSFITLPKLPVMVMVPLPGEINDSINNISPPTLVQANPVTTPATSLLSYLSLIILGAPRTLIISSSVTFLLYSSSIATDLAAFLITCAIFASNPRTPDSLVYPSTIFSNCFFPIVKSFEVNPCSFN